MGEENSQGGTLKREKARLFLPSNPVAGKEYVKDLDFYFSERISRFSFFKMGTKACCPQKEGKFVNLF